MDALDCLCFLKRYLHCESDFCFTHFDMRYVCFTNHIEGVKVWNEKKGEKMKTKEKMIKRWEECERDMWRQIA